MTPQRGGNGCRKSARNQHKLRQSKHGQAHRRGKQQRQILGPAFAELREAAIHASADGIAAKAKENPAARSFHRPGQRHVLQQTAAYRRVPADCVVRLARDQDVLAIGRGGRRRLDR